MRDSSKQQHSAFPQYYEISFENKQMTDCPVDVRRLYRDRRIVPFIGAGAWMSVIWGDPPSRRRGPSWEQMVDQAARLLDIKEPELLRVRGTDLQILEYFKIMHSGFAPLTNWLSLEFSGA